MVSTKLGICLSIFVCLVVTAVCERKGYPSSPNCARYECPPYSVVYANDDFEIRSYDDARWMSTHRIPASSYTVGAYKGFLILDYKLFGYIHGNNQQHARIDMTTPVLVDVDNSTYTVYFYLPKSYQKGVPLPPPTTPTLTQIKLPKHKYAAVRRYGGFISEKNIVEELASLKKSLQGTPYQRAAALQSYTVAGYNSPFELTDRVNEVFLWFD